MIGFFDSGFGGMTILKEVVKLLPQYSTVYLGDNARTPYGSRTPETIYQFTKEGVDELFSRGCELVILACNTASAVALRKLQQEHLPKHWPNKKILGIIIPTAEEMLGKKGSVGIFATPATVQSQTFSIEIEKHNNILEKLKITKRQFQNFRIRDSYPVDYVLKLDNNFIISSLEINSISLLFIIV